MPYPRWTKSTCRWHSQPEPNHPPPSVGYHDPRDPLRMTDSSSIDNDLVSLAPTAASILGIKGNLRFRPHGSSQKAHVVLRRVEPESDSDGEGENKGLIQFSLFAYKRIEVKPGKEILLTVGDGPFKDRAIIFEGDELRASSLSDAEEETQVAEDDDAAIPLEHSLPLKMRKPWAKRVEAPPPLGTCDNSHHTVYGTQLFVKHLWLTLRWPLVSPLGSKQIQLIQSGMSFLLWYLLGPHRRRAHRSTLYMPRKCPKSICRLQWRPR